jgi:hypothetical protein
VGAGVDSIDMLGLTAEIFIQPPSYPIGELNRLAGRAWWQ